MTNTKLPSLLLSSLLTASLLLASGCGRTVVKEKETIREQPVVTQERVIVEQPVVVKETVPALRTCTHLGTTYSHGSVSCQSGYQFKCNDGTWDSTNLSC